MHMKFGGVTPNYLFVYRGEMNSSVINIDLSDKSDKKIISR